MSQLPEGRKPLLWKDMPFAERPKAHPSSWEGEAKISRITISRLEARVAELEAVLARLVLCEDAEFYPSAIEKASPYCIDFEEWHEEARAALKGKDDG
jgi:hypothetical protein